MKYKVEITETLSKTVEVEATSLDEAIERVEDQWNNSDIVLYPEDFSFVEFHEAEKEKTIKKFLELTRVPVKEMSKEIHMFKTGENFFMKKVS